MNESPSRILVVDDEPSITEFVGYALKKEGFAPDVVDNGEDALAMAQKNARDAADKRAAQLRRSYERTTGALEELKNALGLEKLPRRIEGYDISNTQGALSVASMVVMQDGLPAKKEYRHFRKLCSASWFKK